MPSLEKLDSNLGYPPFHPHPPPGYVPQDKVRYPQVPKDTPRVCSRVLPIALPRISTGMLPMTYPWISWVVQLGAPCSIPWGYPWVPVGTVLYPGVRTLGERGNGRGDTLRYLGSALRVPWRIPWGYPGVPRGRGANLSWGTLQGGGGWSIPWGYPGECPGGTLEKTL